MEGDARATRGQRAERLSKWAASARSRCRLFGFRRAGQSQRIEYAPAGNLCRCHLVLTGCVAIRPAFPLRSYLASIVQAKDERHAIRSRRCRRIRPAQSLDDGEDPFQSAALLVIPGQHLPLSAGALDPLSKKPEPIRQHFDVQADRPRKICAERCHVLFIVAAHASLRNDWCAR